jgi:hypothetical protein
MTNDDGHRNKSDGSSTPPTSPRKLPILIILFYMSECAA